MLSASGLSNTIIATLKGCNSPAQAMFMLGKAITDYLCNNTTVVFSWVGVLPGPTPTPDPVVIAKSTNIVGNIVLVPTMATDATTNGIMLGAQIQAGILSFQVMPPPGFLIPPVPFLAAAPILLVPTMATSMEQHWAIWSQIIISTFKTYINPMPLPGLHGVYTSTPGAIMTAIL